MKQKTLTLSIVIPAYNEEGYILDCLEAISYQTVMPLEVIVVDNNCNDKTVQLAKLYPFVRIVREKQQGIVYARNRGFDSAHGDIIGRIDSDTQLDPLWVETVLNYFTNYPNADAVTGNCYFYDFPARALTQTVHHLAYYSLQKAITGGEILWGSNMAIRRTVWKSVKPYCTFDNSVHEDMDLTIHLVDEGFSVVRTSSMLAGVSMRRGNLNPHSIIKYLKPWPLTYWNNKKYFSGICIGVLFLLVIVGTMPLLLVHEQRRIVNQYN
jgi:glycosyltransferase involved in cell wall biosynthesis